MVVCDAAFWQEVANGNGHAERDRRFHGSLHHLCRRPVLGPAADTRTGRERLDRHVASFATANHFVPALPGGDVGEQIPRIRVDLRQVQLLEM